MKIPLIPGAAALILLACAPMLSSPARVQITPQVADPLKCQYLGEVRSDDKLYGNFLVGLAKQSAQSQILSLAAKMGANTVELAPSSAGWASTNASGKAYRCI